MIIAANQDTVFRRLTEVMGRPELADDERFRDHTGRGTHQDLLDELIGDWAATLTARELIDTCIEGGVVAGPVNTVVEAMAEPQFLARGLFVDHERTGAAPVKGVDVVPRLSETRVECAGPDRTPPAPTTRRCTATCSASATTRSRSWSRTASSDEPGRRHPRGRPARRAADRGPDHDRGQAPDDRGAGGHRRTRDRGDRLRLASRGAGDGRRRTGGRAARRVARRGVLRAGREPGRREAGSGRRHRACRVRRLRLRVAQPGQREVYDGRGDRADRRGGGHRP